MPWAKVRDRFVQPAELPLRIQFNVISLFDCPKEIVMTKAPQERRRKALSNHDREAACPQAGTVASLGIQARLVPAVPERDREVACLIARYERVYRDLDRVVQQALALLGPEVQPNRSGERSPARRRAR
jgi:hypothetical protein